MIVQNECISLKGHGLGCLDEEDMKNLWQLERKDKDRKH